MSENYDSFWVQDWPRKSPTFSTSKDYEYSMYGEDTSETIRQILKTISDINQAPQDDLRSFRRTREEFLAGDRMRFIDEPIKPMFPPELMPGSKRVKIKLKNTQDKEAEMSDIYGTSAADQRAIDDAVREAIARPLREAEIAKRVVAVEALGVEDKYEPGTVLRFKRAINKRPDAHVYTHVAVKIGNEGWLATGGNLTGTSSQTWDDLLRWMTTGEVLVTNVEIAMAWETILA